MPPNPNLNLVQVRCFWTMLGVGASCSLWYHGDGTPGVVATGDVETLAQSIPLALDLQWKQYRPAQSTFIGGEARYWNGSGYLIGDNTEAVAGVADNIYTLPPQLSAVVSFRASTASPRKRGRIYLPFICGIALEANTARIADGVRDDMVAGITLSQESAPETQEWRLVVWSPTANDYSLVTSVTADDIVDTQRRRGFQPA